MKTLILIICLAFFSNVILAQITTRIVDHNFNAPTGPHIYSTIQAAVNAANSGDTIQIQPSPSAYGNVSINRPLVLVGIGFNVVKDIPLESTMGEITLTNNVDNTTQSSGTTIMGLRFTNLFPGVKTGANYTLQNITIFNCIFNAIYSTSAYANVDGMEIYDCYIFSQYSAGTSIRFGARITNSLIRNCLIIYDINFASASAGTNTITNNMLYRQIGVVAEGTNTNIINNVFVGTSTTSYAFQSFLRDCIVSYNIFYGVTPSIAAGGSTSANFQRNVFSFNLLHATGADIWPPAGGGSSNTGSSNYIGSPLYNNVSLLSTWSSAYNFTLDPSSPALLANIPDLGALFDIGLTGGAYPWTETNFVAQTTALPVIELLNTSTIINPGDNLPVHIKATSN